MANAAASFLGKWKSTTIENFDEYLKALDVSFLLRKAGGLATSYLDIGMDGDTWSLKYKIAFKSGAIAFKLGEEFDEDTPDGRKVKSTYTMDGEWLKQIQRGKPHDTTIDRKIQEDGTMFEIAIVPEKNVTTTRTYVRDE